jgi:hypothetical protein
MSLDELLVVGSLWADDVFNGRGRLLAVEDGYVVWGHVGGLVGLNITMPLSQFLREFTPLGGVR